MFTLAVSSHSFQRRSTALYKAVQFATLIWIFDFMPRKPHRKRYGFILLAAIARERPAEDLVPSLLVLAFMSVTGNIPHATDHRCIFHGLYLPVDKSARGQVIIHVADLHQNIPCLLLTTDGHAKVHFV